MILIPETDLPAPSDTFRTLYQAPVNYRLAVHNRPAACPRSMLNVALLLSPQGISLLRLHILRSKTRYMSERLRRYHFRLPLRFLPNYELNLARFSSLFTGDGAFTQVC